MPGAAPLRRSLCAPRGVVVACVLAATSAPHAVARVDGAGPRTTVTTPLATPTKRLSVRGPITVRVVPDGGHAVEVTAEANLHPHVVVQAKDDILSVRTTQDVSSPGGIVVVVHAPESAVALREIDVGGAVDLDARRLGSESLVVTASGAARLSLAGDVREARFEVRGAAHVEARALHVDAATVVVGGAVDVVVSASRALTVRGGGVGRVRFAGAPTVVRDAPATVVVAPLDGAR